MFHMSWRWLSNPRSGRRLLVVLAMLGLVLADSPASAQAVYGSVAGTVLDNTGGVLPGVTVTITSLERQTVDSVVTNESGFYQKERLLPGVYEVKAELAGFKTALVPRVTVAVDSQVPVNLTMELGELSETVEVTGVSPLLKTDRADVSTRFEAKELTELPIQDRNFTKVLLSTPGTQRLQWSHAASENPQGSTQTQVNGQHFSGTGYQLDGTENRDPILGIIVINPTLESIGESKITSQNYDAEFGQATAGVVSVQTKSGTNNFHGSGFWFYRDESMQARNPYSQARPDPLTGKFIPETTHNQFGGSTGGPIVQNKWFFFGDYQGTRDEVGGSRLLTVPTAAARRGDLSGYGVRIFDPLTGEEFPNAVIPTSRLSQQAQNLLAALPLPNAPGSQNGTRDNYVASATETFDEDSFNVRIDGRLSDAINTFGRYSQGGFFRDGPTAFGTAGGQEVVSLGGVSDVDNKSLAYGVDWALSNSLLADFRFGWFQYKVNVLPFDFGTSPMTDAGVPGLNFDDFSSGLSAMFIEGDRGFNMGSGLGVNRCNCPLDQNEKQWQIVGNVTKLWGAHTMKFGLDVRRADNLRVPSDNHRSGELSFSQNRTASPTLGGGFGFATFLLGDVTRFGRYVSTSTSAKELQWRHAYYAQDTWRLGSKLTLSYGLRLDIINPQTVNEAGNGGWIDLNTGEVLVGGVGGIDLAGNVENTLNWAPRLGVTYQLTDRSVLRAGYGRSYDLGVFGSIFGHTVTQNLPVLSVQNLNAPSNFDRVFNLAQGPPSPTFVDVPADGRFPLPNGVTPRVVPREQELPAVDAWNVSYQQQLGPVTSFEAAYVGTYGRRVFTGDNPDTNYNQPSLEGYLQGVPRDQRKPFYQGGVANQPGVGGAYGWTQDVLYYGSVGENSYHAMQLRFTKRFSDGWSGQINYTLQRAEGEHDDYWIYDPDLSRGPRDFDRTHVFNMVGLYQLPWGTGQRWGTDWNALTNAFLGGWQVNGVLTIQSGIPFNVSYADCGVDRDTGPCRPNLIGDPDGPQTRDQWFNTTPIGTAGSAFERPARGTFGNLGYNELRGPGFWQLDMSLFKSFGFGADKRLELRIEAINALNHVNLGQPDSEIGVPGNDRPNAGRITSTAYFGTAPQRQFQFGLRFVF
jgi:outer membrane receptor protein involved in Fe transport